MTQVATIPTAADKINGTAHAEREPHRRPRVTMTQAERDAVAVSTEKALDIADRMLTSTACRFVDSKELDMIGLQVDNAQRPMLINYLADDETTAGYDNRMATARIVRDHLIGAHLAYREAKNYRELFAAAKLVAANNAGIKAKTDAAAAQSAVRLAQFAALCDTFRARDYASVAYLLRNRLTSWARFDETAGSWIVASPIIGAAKGTDKWRALSTDDIRDVRLSLENAARAVAESPDAAFMRSLASFGLADPQAEKVSADDMQADNDLVNAAVSRKDRLPIVDAFAALNIDSASLCLKAWVANHTLCDAATLTELFRTVINEAYAEAMPVATAQATAQESADETYADDESAILNS